MPAAVVTTSPTDIPSLFGLTVKVLVPIPIDEVVLVVSLYLKSVYDPDNVMAEPATPL